MVMVGRRNDEATRQEAVEIVEKWWREALALL